MSNLFCNEPGTPQVMVYAHTNGLAKSSKNITSDVLNGSTEKMKSDVSCDAENAVFTVVTDNKVVLSFSAINLGGLAATNFTINFNIGNFLDVAKNFQFFVTLNEM